MKGCCCTRLDAFAPSLFVTGLKSTTMLVSSCKQPTSRHAVCTLDLGRVGRRDFWVV